jgi:hypothetical protein
MCRHADAPLPPPPAPPSSALAAATADAVANARLALPLAPLPPPLSCAVAQLHIQLTSWHGRRAINTALWCMQPAALAQATPAQGPTKAHAGAGEGEGVNGT